jgi:DNA-formamidopyrimidine glycosylase
MPELPEVETVRRGLEPALVGARIREVELRRPDLRFPLPNRFAERLTGCRVSALRRRAKYLIAELDSGEALVMHLGMTGRFRVEHDGASRSPGRFHHAVAAGEPHDHVVLRLSNGDTVTYNDARRFGFMDLVAQDALETSRHFARMGIEPLDEALSGETIARLFQGRRAPLKAALMDQRLIAGLGNIYVCEALFRAGLDPDAPAGSLATPKGRPGGKAHALAAAIRAVLTEAIEAGGSTLRDYAQTDGSLGYFQHRFRVYGRAGEKCLAEGCGGIVARWAHSGRSTFSCPVCQRPGAELRRAVTISRVRPCLAGAWPRMSMVSPSAEPIRLPTSADVRKAATRIAGVAHRTPVLTSRTADARAGARLFFKCENLQRSGAFKFRGAYNAISALSGDKKGRGVVAFSSGNHAQAIAMAGGMLGVPTVIVMPTDAPEMKVAATRAYGGEIVLYDRYAEDREAIGRGLSETRGLTLIPPFDHADVIAGQGTAALELIEEAGPLDVLVTPLGGGGLLSGTALIARDISPACRIYGVEPQAGDDGRRSFRSGEIVRIPVPVSIADGALTTALGQRTFPIIRALVDDIVTVPDAALVEAMHFFAERMKIVVEPTGCLAAAAVLSHIVPVEGLRVGIVLSGGNVDPRALGRLLA